jgi:hypothetical protein
MHSTLILNLLIVCIMRSSFLEASTATIGRDGLKKLSNLMHTLKPARNLVCLIKAEHQKSQKQFLMSAAHSESLKLHLFTKGPWLGLMDMQFSFLISDLMSITVVAHPAVGVVEEITLYGQGSQSPILTFQHDGEGRLIWAEGSNDIRMVTCHVEQRLPKDPFL